MEEWNENREELIDLFGKVRDDWLYSSKQVVHSNVMKQDHFFFLILIPDEMNYEKLKAITELVIALSIDVQIKNVAASARRAELLLTLKVDSFAI